MNDRQRARLLLLVGLLVLCLGAKWTRAAENVTGLTWEQHQGYRLARLRVPTEGHSGFTLLTPEQTGVRLDPEVTQTQLLTTRTS